ncbi:hypothetical protein CVU82_01845 [Candidatus Falkowbacteria bacterium HGW-Falkowbacteria-1]|jgi:hypothetical protein|uniref:Uncharacterized protein n=1 Tax=Candidatus Falkowbacteria bacterium HGW-Falkowbacteria-1 TaxID=2013768 RepID=A0A2N2E9G9_9BACT|nr:MAG: hypothetical protein CVU82_01845 [Candidatus Falkowbacteria bacterium HGW-Falkowbacteria-1]
MKKDEIAEIDRLLFLSRDLLLREIMSISQFKKFLDGRIEEEKKNETIEEEKNNKRVCVNFSDIIVKIDSLESLITELKISIKDQRINFTFFPPHYNREVYLETKLFSFEDESFSSDIISIMNDEDFRPACFHELIFCRKFFSRKKRETTPIVSLLFPYSPPSGGKFSPFLNDRGEIYLSNFNSSWEKNWRFLGVKMK